MSGTSNSGRPRLHGILEQRLRVDIRTLRRLAGVLTWRDDDGEETASAGYQVLPDALQLAYRVEDVPVQFRVTITRMPCWFGGTRRYFSCPHCRRRCEVLALGSNGRSWACRRCLGLRYACQRLAPAWRMQARADKSFARLCGDYEVPVRPKWMRWQTFNRKLERAEELANLADAFFAARVMYLTGMLFDELAESLK